jgi:outer membrane cobalamin receptor
MVSATLRFTGKRWVREDNTVDQIYLMTDKYPEYLIFDAMIQRNIKSWNIALQLDNLFNKIFINNRGYKSPGRMLFLKVTYSFTEK